MKRPPSTPPEIAGFTHLQLLGSGGFADVFLYEQKMPRRRVAIKVLLPDRIAASASQFTTEANVMAMLGAHPAIVAIYEAGVAEDGRPYLVMEYCPRPNLQVRYRRARFSVEEALATGIPVAAAVETAHRANVLHRDIKPANILVTEYNRPALTDFGIASSDAHPDETQGVSVPWSPPEAFADPPRSDARSDVYQLGATVYTLLAGRSPFEVVGGNNGVDALIDRIESVPLPELDRDDVPESLARVLEQSMAKDPAERHPTASAFARALQSVQAELGTPITPIDILDDGGETDLAFDDDVAGGTTRIRPFTDVATVLRSDGSRPSGHADPFVIPETSTGDQAAFAPEAVAASDAPPPAEAPPVDDATHIRAVPSISDAPAEPPAGVAPDVPSGSAASPIADAPAASPTPDTSSGDDAPAPPQPIVDDTQIRPRRAADDAARPGTTRPDEPRVGAADFAPAPEDASVQDDTVARPPRRADDRSVGAVPVARRQDPSIPDYAFDTSVEFGRGSVPVANPSVFRTADPTPVVPATPTPPSTPAAARKSRRLAIAAWVIGAIVVVAIGIVVWAILAGLPTDEEQTDGPDRDVLPVTDLVGVSLGGEVRFTWDNPDGELGDTYLWGIYDDERVTALDSRTDQTSVTIEPDDGAQTCIEVLIERSDGSRSPTEVACIDNAG